MLYGDLANLLGVVKRTLVILAGLLDDVERAVREFDAQAARGRDLRDPRRVRRRGSTASISCSRGSRSRG